jgi:integrase
MKSDRGFVRIRGSRSKPVLEPYMLLTSHFRPWQENHLTRAIKAQCVKLGIEDRQLHGLRKTTASKLAELGCTPHEIASITGQSLQEVEHYTKGVEQKRMAVSAMGKWENGGLDRPSV